MTRQVIFSLARRVYFMQVHHTIPFCRNSRFTRLNFGARKSYLNLSDRPFCDLGHFYVRAVPIGLRG